MYIRTFEGLGLGEPKDVLVGTCRAWVVNVPFKKDYQEFRAEVWKAIGRHVERANKTKLALLAEGISIETLLKAFHNGVGKQPDKLEFHKNNVPMKATLHSSSEGKLTWVDVALLGGFSYDDPSFKKGP